MAISSSLQTFFIVAFVIIVLIVFFYTHYRMYTGKGVVSIAPQLRLGPGGGLFFVVTRTPEAPPPL
jgi:hypothetical protein